MYSVSMYYVQTNRPLRGVDIHANHSNKMGLKVLTPALRMHPTWATVMTKIIDLKAPKLNGIM